jgi:branched-chain amino acid aminotransferase
MRGTAFVPAAECSIDPRSQAFNYGFSVFEGIRAYWDEASEDLAYFRLYDHLRRLERSARLLHLTLPCPVDELAAKLCELARRNGHREDVYLRTVCFKGIPSGLGVTFTDAPDDFLAYIFPQGEYLARSRPIRAITSSWARIADAAAPARAKIGGTYVNPGLAKTGAVLAGFDECIMLNSRGLVAEGSTSNVFGVIDGQLVTPRVADDILVGITRATVIVLAQQMGLDVAERAVSRSELLQATEVFLVGTGAEVAAVGELDGVTIGDGEVGTVTAEVASRYRAIVTGDDGKYSDWLTKVWGAEHRPVTIDTAAAERRDAQRHEVGDGA